MKTTSRLAGAMLFAALSGLLESQHKEPEKQKKKCLLPECDELTEHNGGYCSAEHCRLAKQKSP